MRSEIVRSERSHQPLPPSEATVRAQLLARAGQGVRQLGLVTPEPQRHVFARHAGERDQGKRGPVWLGQRRKRGGDKRDGRGVRDGFGRLPGYRAKGSACDSRRICPSAALHRTARLLSIISQFRLALSRFERGAS